MTKGKDDISEFRLELKPMEEGDLPELSTILKDAFNADSQLYLGKDDGPRGYDDGQLLRRLQTDPGHTAFSLWLNGEDGGCVGGIVLKVNEETQVHQLELLFVNPNLHGRGLGAIAWKRVEEHYPNARRWCTETPIYSRRNLHFYINKLGFHAVRLQDPFHDENGSVLLEKVVPKRTQIGTGNTATIYLEQGSVVKLFHAEAAEGEAEQEAKKQRIAYRLEIPVPEVMDLITIDERQAIRMEHVAGPTLGEQMLQESSTARDVLTLAVDMQNRVHEADAPELPLLTERLTQKIGWANGLSPSQKEELLRRMPVGGAQKLLHGDFHVFNVVQTEQGLVVLDWVDATAGEPAADLCRSYLLYHELSQEAAELYLELACDNQEDRRAGILQWLPFVAAGRLSENPSPEQREHLISIVAKALAIQ
ncbi:GNAT family N-acetyltransferase [Gorillibacterium sp. CAU 1737]|uniref:GNAT family N-acetyltransferase n=1 Tax=Gorillibacterium sp. CAU 1737 TaxID=3140362 RepID=UPI0032603F95